MVTQHKCSRGDNFRPVLKTTLSASLGDCTHPNHPQCSSVVPTTNTMPITSLPWVADRLLGALCFPFCSSIISCPHSSQHHPIRNFFYASPCLMQHLNFKMHLKHKPSSRPLSHCIIRPHPPPRCYSRAFWVLTQAQLVHPLGPLHELSPLPETLFIQNKAGL